MEQDCIFCEINKKELPSSRLTETEKSYAFLDLHPVTKGHTLIISKEHYKNFLETPDETINDMMKLTKKITPIIKKAVKADGFNISTNIETSAGQSIFHTHIHIVPRFKDDGLKLFPGHISTVEELNPLAEKIISLLK